MKSLLEIVMSCKMDSVDKKLMKMGRFPDKFLEFVAAGCSNKEALWKYEEWLRKKKWRKRNENSCPVNIKIGRTCYSCKFRKSKKGSFISCRHMLEGKSIWAKAHCPKWRLTGEPKRLGQMERFVSVKGMATNMKGRSYYYKKNTSTKAKEDAELNLGRCCFTCKHRSRKVGSKVECEKHDVVVWEMAACQDFKLDLSRERLSLYKRYFKDTGVNTFGDSWAIQKRTEHFE